MRNLRHRKARLLLLALVVLVGLLLAYFTWNYSRPALMSDLAPLSLAGRQRLLVVAPHCDDETLGAGGVIQEALRLGMEVRVVIETNGDGFMFATMDQFHRIYPRHSDYIQLGNIRQQESLNALRILGVDSARVIFLSYPDRGTPSLWNDNWLSTDPYHSPFSGATHSPYPITYDPQAVYAGQDLLADLHSIISTYRPDLVIYPHPEDVHRDHWGLSAFTRLALDQVRHEDSSYQPEAYAYLVHRPDYPEPRGLHPQDNLLPPNALFNVERNWFGFALSPEDVTRKGDATNQYRSQLPFLRGLMDSFVRRNELFSKPSPAVLATLADDQENLPSTWRDTNGNPIEPIQRDPVKDFFTRDITGSADLVGLYAARKADNTLVVCASLRGTAEPAFIYTLRILAFDGKGVVHHVARNHERQPGWVPLTITRNSFCNQVSLAELGNPWLVFVGADVDELGVGALDQTAWKDVLVTPGG